MPREEPVLYCICRSTDGERFMVCCDSCDQWFHGDCVDITEEQSQFLSNYYCPDCREKKGLESIWFNSCSQCKKPASAGSKYCSDQCGIQVARKRLCLILEGKWPGIQARDFNEDEFDQSASKRRNMLNEDREEWTRRIDVLARKLRDLNDAVLFADLVSRQLLQMTQQQQSAEDGMQVDLPELPVCGFDARFLTWSPSTSDNESYLKQLQPETMAQPNELLAFLKGKICLNLRNKCPKHTHVNLPVKSNLEITTESIDGNEIYAPLLDEPKYPLPNWAHLHAHLLDVEREENEKQVKDVDATLERLKSNNVRSIIKLEFDSVDGGQQQASMVCRALYEPDMAAPASIQVGTTLFPIGK